MRDFKNWKFDTLYIELSIHNFEFVIYLDENNVFISIYMHNYCEHQLPWCSFLLLFT